MFCHSGARMNRYMCQQHLLHISKLCPSQSMGSRAHCHTNSELPLSLDLENAAVSLCEHRTVVSPGEQCLVQWQGRLWQADGRADGCWWFCRLGVCRQANGAQCNDSRGTGGTEHCRCSRTERVKHLSQINLLGCGP